jgi:hypothetical protein
MNESVQSVQNEPAAGPGAPAEPTKTGSRLGSKQIRLGAVLAILIAAGLVAWLLLDRNNSSFSLAPVTPIAPQVLTADGLKSTVSQLGQPVYWAGPKPGYTYELARDRKDDIHVTYLPPGKGLGAKGTFLVIGTFRFVNALSAVQRAGHNKGSLTVKVPNNGVAVYSPQRPDAYWFATPGSHYQAGVFTPNSPPLARRLVLGGKVVPVG